MSALPNHNYLLGSALTISYVSGDFDVLDALLEMRDFNMYGTQPGKGKAKCSLIESIWSSQIDDEQVKQLLELLVNKHQFNLNNSKEFCVNLLSLIERHSKYNTSNDSREEMETKRQAAELFH